MKKFKDELAEMKGKAAELSERADKLKNKNLRDIVKTGIVRIEQALGHPDIDAASDDEHREHTERSKRDGPKYDLMGNPLSGGTGDAGNMQLGAGDTQKPPPAEPFPGAKHPGDPDFHPENNNAGFRHPDGVDLNKDGTLKKAPNAFGQADDRDKE